MQLTAKLVQVLPIQSGMGKNGEWKRQNIIVETDGMYPKKICITLWGEKVGDSMLQEGALLDISFDLESREFNGRWYTDVRAWKVELAGGTQNGGAGYSASDDPRPAQPVDFGGESGDDLPF